MNTPCSKCGGDAPKYKRLKLRKNGRRTKSTATYCMLCHREDQKIREERRYGKKLAYNRAWKKRNRDKANEYARKDYWKNRTSSFGTCYAGDAVEWKGTTNEAKFSTLTYYPLYVSGERS